MQAWLKVHWFWLVFIAIGIISFYSWLQEHDARLQSDAAVKVAQSNVTALQSQIASNNQTITQLQAQMAQNDLRTQQQLQTMQTLIQSVKTPQQAATAIPELTDNKVQPVTRANGDLVIPQSQAVPLFQELAQGKSDALSLATCKSDVTTETQVAQAKDKTITDDEGIITQKNNEIAALKKKPGFWHRVGSVLKQVGIGFATGYVAGKL